MVEDLPGGDLVAVEVVSGGRREAEDVVAHVVEALVDIPLLL